MTRAVWVCELYTLMDAVLSLVNAHGGAPGGGEIARREKVVRHLNALVERREHQSHCRIVRITHFISAQPTSSQRAYRAPT